MWEDILCIWSRDTGRFPQGSPVHGWFGFLMRLKATICALLRREGDPWNWRNEHVPVYIGPLSTSWNGDGPSADWSEIGVGVRWRDWRLYRYRNGI